MKRHLKKNYALPGSRRAARIAAESKLRRQLLAKLALGRPPRRPQLKNAKGLKRLYVPGGESRRLLTPYGRKLLAARRAARKVAHESRRANRLAA